MTLDRRLRESLERASGAVDPELARNLEAVQRRATQRSDPPLGSLLLATLVVAFLVVVPGLLGGLRTGPAATSAPPPSGVVAASAVAGTWSTTLEPADPGVAGLGLAGVWSMTFRSDGIIELVPPPAFTGSRASGHSFAVEGPDLRTDLFSNDYCGSLGRYAWTRTATRLTLAPMDDGCEMRRVLLGTRPWTLADR